MKSVVINNSYSILSSEFLKSYIITMRPYLMFVSAITGLAGFSFGSIELSLELFLLFSAAFLSYGFGQALTDCFQIDTDSISSPYRPLTKGVVSKRQILFLSIAGLSYCVIVFTSFNKMNLLLGIISGLGLATYTPFKRKWWGGPFYNSWIVGVLFLMSFLSSTPLCGPNSIKILSALSAVFFGYANFVLSGYFKDISADRLTGYNTLPVVFGRKISSIVCDVFAALTFLFSLMTIFIILIDKDFNNSFLPIIFLVIAAIVLINAQVHLHQVTKDDEAYHSISRVVHSYILFLSSITFANKPEWFLILLIFYLCYFLVLKARPAKNQI